MSLKIHTRRRGLAGASVLALVAALALPLGAAVSHAEMPVTGAVVTYADIVAAAKPAVVTITTEMPVQASAEGQTPFGPGQAPFDQFFQQFFGQEGPGGQPQPQARPQRQTPHGMGLGSGFIVDASGVIVTNNHVIDGATKITVTLDDGRELPATLVGRDAKSDIAVLRITADAPLPVVGWGASDALRLGDGVVAIGNPFGVGTTVTSGIVSARGRDLHNGPYDDFIQVDAAINHGNSGGPLLNAEGQVVGINSAIYSPNGGNVGVGFAIPSAQAEKVVARILANGDIEHGFIGVQIQPLDADIASSLGLKGHDGALIAMVNDGSPAATAGLKSGDVVLGLDAAPVATPKDLSRLVADLAPGATAKLKVWRDGKEVTLPITVGKFAEDTASVAEPASGVDIPALGLSVQSLSAADDQQMGLPEGTAGVLVTALTQDGTAAQKGLAEGDVILSVNQQPVASAQDVTAAVADARAKGRAAVLIGLQRNTNQSFVAVPLA